MSNVDIKSVEYLTTLSDNGIGKGKDGKGLDLIEDISEDELEDNHIELLSEVRKLLAVKLADHNNVYDSVKSILNKLLSIKEIDQTKYDKILN